MSLSKVIEIARLELGVTEDPPGTNRVKYWDIFGPEWQGNPWCVAFIAWCFDKAGERMAFFGGGKTASCGTLLRWYKEQGLTVDVSDIQVGDIALLNFHGGKDTEHCGLVVGKGVENFYWFVKTIEGNTSSGGSQDNGGAVCEKERYEHQIVAVCRPQYQPEPVIVDDITGHWAAPAIEWAKEMGLIKGYPDGSFKPNQPITRAEACVMFERFYELLWENDMC